ncbi:MAG: hypothetical protein E7812_10935 [Phenylobacterium sp.]|nr:MAG: hypothetical protein E7812_10935 [Phenylobacterium sp.]
MKVFAITVAALTLASAGAAAAQDQVSDQAFMTANRCKGLAMGLGVDATTVRTFIKQQSRSRPDVLIYRGQGLTSQAMHEASDPVKKPQLTAELSTSCAAFMGGGGGDSTAATGAQTALRR